MTEWALQQRMIFGLGLAISLLAPAAPVLSAEPDQAILTLSPDAPARLVLAYWPDAGWQVRKNGRLVEITLPGVGLAIDTGAIAIPAADGAIASITTELTGDSTKLRFGLGCDCSLVVQGDGERLLIDVVGSGKISDPVYREKTWAPELAPIPVARHMGLGGETDGLRQIDTRRVEETRARLLAEMRRAADAGLVILRPGAIGLLAQTGPGEEMHEAETAFVEAYSELNTNPDAEPLAEADAVFAGKIATEPAAAAGGDGDLDLGASVFKAATPEMPVLVSEVAPGGLADPRQLPDPVPPVERARPDLGASSKWWRATVAASPAPACFSNGAFRLTDPLPPPVLIAEISRLRRALIGEFDRADAAAALSLSRLYLAHGLGVEAAFILAEFAPDAPEAGLLSALAWLAEGKALPYPNVLSVSGCTGQHALWQGLDAALAERTAQAVELEAVAIGALEQTARGLRGRIAVRLGLAATIESDWIAAYRLHAMAKRAIPDDDRFGQDMRSILEARIELNRGNVLSAVARLTELNGSRSPAGAEALLMLAELATDPAVRDAIPLERLRLDLGVLATMQRDTPMGERAFLSEARLTGLLNGREAAFELLAYGLAGRLIGEEAYRNALVAVEASLSARFEDMDTPLALLFEADPTRFAGALDDPGFRVALAQSYLGLGAPVLAETVLAPTDLQSQTLLAELTRTYLAVGDIGAADRVAARLPEGPDRAAVEAAVAQANGDTAQALIALIAADASAPRRARAAWAAGAWMESATALTEVISAPDADAGPGRNGISDPTPMEDPARPLSQAAHLAVAARLAGSAATPPEALSVAGAVNPDLEAGLQAIFAPLPEVLADPSPEAVAGYLETFSAEARLIEEILEDG